MKAVILLAGMGKRISGEYNGIHKSLIHIKGKPALYYLLKNIEKAGFDEIIPVLGYRGREIEEYIKHNTNCSIKTVWNKDYETTNNLASLLQAQQHVSGEDFVEINGDMVFDYRILEDISKIKGTSIAVDTYRWNQQVDSPKISGTLQHITNLGRKIPMEDSIGYAVGIYKFGANISKEYFDCSREYLHQNPMMGFHDPLISLFWKYDVTVSDVKDYLWMDIDTVEDVKLAEEYIMRLGYA